MKAITILQPYAALICLRDDDPRAKRVENRHWPASYRGELLIHAGKGRSRLVEGIIPDRDCDACRGTGFVDVDTGRSIEPGVGWSGMNMAAECGCGIDADDEYGIPLDAMAFGAAVAVARLADCFRPGAGGVVPESAQRRRPWLIGHEHVEGPWCWVLSEVRPLPEPIPWRGMQGLWCVPPDLAARVREQLEAAPR